MWAMNRCGEMLGEVEDALEKDKRWIEDSVSFINSGANMRDTNRRPVADHRPHSHWLFSPPSIDC